MNYSLSNFYQSSAWGSLREYIIDDRTQSDGNVFCEYCGKPIVHKYDCIGHHTVVLTERNVNDAAVSLNPQLIQLVHHKCHNRIHNKLGTECRTVYLVYGAPLSGKTTYVESVREPGDLVVDMDHIWQCLSGCPRYVKPDRLKANVFGVRDELLRQVQYRTGKWINAYVIGGYPFARERERLISRLGAREIFIDTPMEECLARCRADADRNFSEWEKFIREWFNKYSPQAV